MAGEQLTALLPVLRAFADKASQVPAAERGPLGISTRRERYEGDVGIVIDWAALPQRSELLGLELSAAEEERMPEAVRRMNALYAMAHTFVIMLSGTETNGTGAKEANGASSSAVGMGVLGRPGGAQEQSSMRSCEWLIGLERGVG